MTRVNEDGHDFDIYTECCMRCGIPRVRALEELFTCIGRPDVIAITHLRVRQRLDPGRYTAWDFKKMGLYRPTGMRQKITEAQINEAITRLPIDRETTPNAG